VTFQGSREPVATASGDPTADRADRLRALFPDAFADGKLDMARLRAALGETVAPDGETYSFGWAGRGDAVEILRTPTRATLMPAPEESVAFDATRNLYIEGDNLEVLKLLYKPYAGRVKLIYIDPPYNTGQDFIYPDDFRDTLANYLKLTGQADDAGKLLRSNPETGGRYHSDWLSMMYPRLFLARQLLRDDGVIFVSIDDHEVHHLRLLMNEVFGEENFVATLVWEKSKKGDAKLIAVNHEYVHVFAKDKQSVLDVGKWRRKKNGVDEVLAHYQQLRKDRTDDHIAISDAMKKWYASLPSEDPRRGMAHYRVSDDRGLYFPDNFAGPDDGRKSRPRYDIIHPVTKKPCKKPSTGWRWEEETTNVALAQTPPRIHFGIDENTIPCRKTYLAEIDSEPFASVFYRDGRAATLEVEKLLGAGLMDFPKNVDVLKELIALGSDDDSIILDFFSGSATTAQAVLELNREDGGNRRFILVQLPEPTGNKKYPTIAEIGKERVRRVIGRLKGEPGSLARTEPEDLGFKVFKLAESHFTQWAGVPERTPEALQRQMRLIADDPLHAGWTPANLLWEVAIKEGYGLNSTIAEVPGVSATVYEVADAEKGQRFRACLEDAVPADIAKQLGLTADDLFVVRDLALDDTLASNLALQCRLKVI